ncbi:unnamed protein product [Ectocarpus sp. 8 AP-2014]
MIGGGSGSSGVLTVGCGVAESLLAGIIKLWCLLASCRVSCLAKPSICSQ